MAVSGLNVLRYAVFVLFLCSLAIAAGSWAVRSRRINPFGRLGQFVRRFSDPILAPIERWLLRRGGNPQNAGWWLLGAAVIGGILLITLLQWLVTEVTALAGSAAAGPRGIFRILVYYASQVFLLALIIRVIGSWFGIGRFNRWMRPVYALTDWIVRPLHRVIPPIGMIDITPLVAWFLILVLRGWLLRLI